MTVISAKGATIARGDGASPEAYTVITQPVTINPVGAARTLRDITNLASTSREWKKNIKDGQEIECRFQYDPSDAAQIGLKTDRDSEDARSFRVTLKNNAGTNLETITFDAQVTKWIVTDILVDGDLMLDVTLKPTGDLTHAVV